MYDMKKFSQIHITPAGLQNAKEVASACHFSREHHVSVCTQVLKRPCNVTWLAAILFRPNYGPTVGSIT
jgi:hypothetical protein